MLRLSVIALLALAACGGSKRAAVKSEAPGEPAYGQDMEPPPKDQIIGLEQQISTDLAQLGLAEPMESDWQGAPAEPMAVPTAAQDPTCKPAKTETCTTSCTLSDSICKNSEAICRLAAGMNDAWARGRCAKANKTCERAKGRCCGCQ
ncbi:MAG TPA: hypothetical protein VIV11_02280 [Kofleriaceae bacterium]